MYPSPVCGHLDCLQLLAVVNAAAVHSHGQVCVYLCMRLLLLARFPRAHLYASCLPAWLYDLTCLPTLYGSSCCIITSPNLDCLKRNCGCSSGCDVVSPPDLRTGEEEGPVCRWRGFMSRGLGDTRLLEMSAELQSQKLQSVGSLHPGCEQSDESGDPQRDWGPVFRSPLYLCFGCHRNNTVSSPVPLFLLQNLTRPFTLGNYQ